MSMSEEFLNGFRFILVVFMKNLFIVLEIILSFMIIPSFSTSVILLEFDLLLLTCRFTVLSVTSLTFILLKYCLFDFLRRLTQ